jgi:uncharacterized membrane protein
MVAFKLRGKLLHWAFRLGILFKGVDGLLELVGGVLFLCVSHDAMTKFVFRITRSELMEDPDDLVANGLRHAFGHLSSGNKFFVAVYLLGHGLNKLTVFAGLLAEKRWVFPVACGLLGAFIVYQIIRLTGHFTIGLTVFTALDMVIVALIWNEYRNLKKQNPGSTKRKSA